MPAMTAALFDLDGTLIDTAPDMAGALNELLLENHRAELPYQQLRAHVSTGSAGLIRQGFGELEPRAQQALVLRFLEIYDARVSRASVLFEGIDTLLCSLESRGVAWGIVTNKPGWLTAPLLQALGLTKRAGAVVCGDTLAERKPHPMPLLHAAAAVHQPPQACIYVGDDARDIQAGQAAGMRTVAAAYGYVADANPADWRADACAGSVTQLTDWLLERAEV